MVALLPSTDAQGYINYIVNNFINKDNTYLDSNYLSINIKLIHREGEAPISRQIKNGKIKDSDLTIFNHYRIPGFINPYDMGNVIDITHNGDMTKYWVNLGGGRSLIAEQIINEHGYISSNISLIKDGSAVIKAKDVQTSPDRFTRAIEVGDVTKVWIYDMSGNNILKYNDINTSIMEPAKVDIAASNKIIAYDIETTQAKVGDKLILEPYLACFVTNSGKEHSFYLTDFNSSEELIKASLMALLRRVFTGYTIYVHNLSNFDSNFILKYLAVAFGKAPIKLIYKEGKIISIKVFYGGKGVHGRYPYDITFVDSYQLLPSSLEKLAVAFELPIGKTSFAHDSVNKDSLVDLRQEAIKYCLNDCHLLLGVILKFQEAIFDNFKVDVTKSPTLSSLSFKIFSCGARTFLINA